jgi:hypothetical protein
MAIVVSQSSKTEKCDARGLWETVAGYRSMSACVRSLKLDEDAVAAGPPVLLFLSG